MSQMGTGKSQFLTGLRTPQMTQVSRNTVKQIFVNKLKNVSVSWLTFMALLYCPSAWCPSISLLKGLYHGYGNVMPYLLC